MPNVMRHPHQHHNIHHHFSWYVLLAIMVSFALILTLSIVPTITLPSKTIHPAYFKETAYFQHLLAEKAIYTHPAELNAALTAYHAGEKILYDRNSATWAYHLGEKNAVLDITALNAEDALYAQRMGEKGIE